MASESKDRIKGPNIMTHKYLNHYQ